MFVDVPDVIASQLFKVQSKVIRHLTVMLEHLLDECVPDVVEVFEFKRLVVWGFLLLVPLDQVDQCLVLLFLVLAVGTATKKQHALMTLYTIERVLLGVPISLVFALEVESNVVVVQIRIILTCFVEE